MNSIDIPTWILPLLALCGSAVGAWAAVRTMVAELQVQMRQVREDVANHDDKLARHNDDLLAHDFEIESALSQLDLPRARRQRLRGT